ncbi:MAG: hypothetical protein ACFHU9_00390 [Fluviicola sp.]
MKNTLFISMVALLLAACNKNEPWDNTSSNNGNESIAITFNTPNENESFDFNETVNVEGWVIGTSHVHGYTVELINQSNQDSILYSHEVHDHGNELQFIESWTNNLSDTSDVLIRIEAFGDHEGGSSETITRVITCNGG